MAEKISIHVCELQPGDRVLGLQVKEVRSKAHYSRVVFVNGFTTLMDTQGDIWIEREVAPAESESE